MDTIALVTLYYPDESVFSNIIQLSKSVSKVVLLDNSPDANKNLIFPNLNDVEYISFNKNLGTSRAFNSYLKSLTNNCFIVFFDQDSFCPSGLITQLKTDYLKAKQYFSSGGIIGPSYYDYNSRQIKIPKLKDRVGEGLYSVPSVITSGLFTELDVLRSVKYWNEKIFLDFSDWDLCWRVKEKGLFCCLSLNCKLMHTLGIGNHKFLLFNVKEDSPIRNYYQTRDCLTLLKAKYTPVKFKLRFIYWITVRPYVLFLLLPHRIVRFKYYIEGLKDFCNNKYGSYNG